MTSFNTAKRHEHVSVQDPEGDHEQVPDNILKFLNVTMTDNLRTQESPRMSRACSQTVGPGTPAVEANLDAKNCFTLNDIHFTVKV